MFSTATAGSTPSVALIGYDPAARSSLTRDERLEYDALTGDARRRDWLAGRTAAKHVVARRTGNVTAADIELVSRDGAAPRPFARIGPTPTALDLSLSIAHRDGWAIAAATDGATRIGVDIDREDGVAESHTRYFVSRGERPALDRLGATALWVLKEAAWKALTPGSTTEFTALMLSFTRDRDLCGVRLNGRSFAARARLRSHQFGFLTAIVIIAQDMQ